MAFPWTGKPKHSPKVRRQPFTRVRRRSFTERQWIRTTWDLGAPQSPWEIQAFPWRPNQPPIPQQQATRFHRLHAYHNTLTSKRGHLEAPKLFPADRPLHSREAPFMRAPPNPVVGDQRLAPRRCVRAGCVLDGAWAWDRDALTMPIRVPVMRMRLHTCVQR